MTNALTEALAVIYEADASPPGSEFGRIPSDLDESLSYRYIHLRFKPGQGQPITYVPVRVSKNAKRGTRTTRLVGMQD